MIPTKLKHKFRKKNFVQQIKYIWAEKVSLEEVKDMDSLRKKGKIVDNNS